MSIWNENLRVYYDRPGQVVELEPITEQRSPAQKAQDEILDKAEAAALEALNKATEAIEWLSIVTPVGSRSAPVYLKQLLAEIVELRRVRQ